MDTREPPAFGQLLREYRQAAGFSQEALAERAGLSTRGISDLERGTRMVPRLETVRLLAEGLGLDRAQQDILLASRTGAPPSPPEGVPAPARASLPVPSTSLVGREREIRETVNLLQREGVRLVTLSGPGGVGKTRLALAVAATLAAEVSNLTFVSLAPVRDPALVTSAIAQALGIQEDGDRSLTDAIVSALDTRHVLLILDNFEHVVEAAPLVATLLAACPHLRVLVTSRAVLHLSGEHNVPVPPLALPDPERDRTVEHVVESAAVRLFVTRAAAARASFVLTESNAPLVAGICQRLEGLPLAIELAAARVMHLPLATLQARLEHSLPLLTGGPCDAPARLRTMRDAIAWSYDLLSPEAQWLFRRLAVFVGGATLEAIMAVIGEEDWVTVLKGIEPLVDQSLLYQVADHTGEPRFRMLEPIREFGLEHLASHVEERAARDAHAAWCLTLGERTFAVLRGSGRSQWFDLVETELGNLRAAFTWLAAQDRVEDSVDLGMGLFFFFHTRGYHSEAFALFEGFLRHPRIARRTRSRAKALLGHGILVEMQGAVEQALEQMLESVDIFHEVGDPVHTGLALVNVGIAYQQLSDFDRAEEANREVLAIGRETNDTWLFKAGLNNLGTVLNDRGQVNRAVPLFEEALAMDRLVDDVYGIELALLNLAEVFLMQEEHERAEPLIQEAFGLLAGLGHRSDLSHAKMLLAQVARARGDYAAAATHLDDAMVTARSIDDKANTARVLLALGDIARLKGDVAGATQQFREGIALSQQIGNRAAVVEGLDGVAAVAVATGAMHQAARLLAAADALLERIRTPRPAGARSRDYEKNMRSAREAMDNDAFTATWSEGRALTTDAAVAEALAFAPDPNPMPVMPIREAHGLTARERDVLRLLASGHSNEQIGEELFISHRTVTTHLTAIFTKLKVSSRSAAAVYAIRHDLA